MRWAEKQLRSMLFYWSELKVPSFSKYYLHWCVLLRCMFTLWLSCQDRLQCSMHDRDKVMTEYE